MSQVHKRAERQRGWKIAGTLVGGAIAALLLGAQVDTPKGEAGESAQLPRPLDLLIGPTTRIGVSTDSKAFDELQLAQGKKYASNFPQFPSDLTASASNQTEGELFWKITEGKGAMPAWKGLSETDRWNLVSYMKSLAK